MLLPTFKYHPDPIATGSIEPSDEVCEVCQQARGAIYTGPIYSEKEIENICPWCIADGTAYERFDVDFVDRAGVGDYGQWESVAEEIIAEVAHRTPGFTGWQQERWFTHCHDAAEFLGRAGREELEVFSAQAIEAIRASADLDEDDWNDYIEALDKDSSPTAYMFRCRHCGAFGGYSDCD